MYTKQISVFLENKTGSLSDAQGTPVFRPSHADYTAWAKLGGHHDIRGGGHFSGRLTAPLCIAGGICLQLLEKSPKHPESQKYIEFLEQTGAEHIGSFTRWRRMIRI